MLKNGPYPYFLQQRVVGDKGHLSNEQASNYLCSWIGPNTKKIVFAHLSEKNNTPEKVIETFNEKLVENNNNYELKSRNLQLDKIWDLQYSFFSPLLFLLLLTFFNFDVF